MTRVTLALVVCALAMGAPEPREYAPAARPTLGPGAGVMRAANPRTAPPHAPSPSWTRPPTIRLRGPVRRPEWAPRVDALVSVYRAGVVVSDGTRLLYSRAGGASLPPSSNQKLLLSMAALDVFGPRSRIATRAVASERERGVVHGDLWIEGRGDPSLASRRSFTRTLRFPATSLVTLARRIRAAGITRVTGDIVGDASYFKPDWDAIGWQPNVQGRFIARPTALALDGNLGPARDAGEPARRAANALRSALIRAGVEVTGSARIGRAPRAAPEIARVASAPLWRQLSYMNTTSSNFFAEMLGKRLAARRFGAPGTIALGALALERWAEDRRVEVVAHDSSGLSYADRISPRALVRLLVGAEREPWGRWLRRVLPRAGEGTLEGRLAGVEVRAKTGTHLNGDSALSGWVRLPGRPSWAAFSILSKGMLKTTEDEIVRAIAGA